MKNLFPLPCWLAIFLCTVAVNAFGQHSVGAYASFVSTDYKGELKEGQEYRFGFSYALGAQLDFQIAKDVYFSLQPGFLQEKGKVQNIAEVAPDSLDWVDTVTTVLNYFALPTNFKIVSNNQKWHFLAGLSFNFPLKFDVTNETETVDSTDKLINLNTAMNFGVAYRFNLKRAGLLHIELRYSQSLHSLTEISNTIFSEVKASSTHIQLGWSIPFAKSKHQRLAE